MNKIINLIKTVKADLFIIFFLLIAASIPRLILLDKIPPGIHGDEGWVGIIAREILSKEPVPAYIEAATGIPSGFIYPSALIFKLFGENIFLLRISFSIIGILTVIAIYIFFRLFFNHKVSLLTALAFNFSLIHIHYSRIAYNIIYLPLFQLMSLIFIIMGRKKNNLVFIIFSAIFAGLGLHSYHPFILFPLTIIFLLLIDIYKQKFSTVKIKELLLFIAVFIIIGLPILKVMIFQPNLYFSHVKSYSIFNVPKIKNQSNLINKFNPILITGFENISHFFLGNRVDFIDAFGKYYNFNKSYIVLFLLGIFLSFAKRKKYNFFILFSLIFFLTPTFFTFEGTYRRSILTLIYFYYFVAIAINWILKIFNKKHHIILFLLITFVILFESFVNLNIYFNKFSKDEETKSVFFIELTEAALLIKTKLSSSNKIYLFSDKNPCSHETIRYLLNKFKCEDRSTEFGSYSLYNIDKPSTILLINKYTSLITEIKSRFKNGEEYLIKDQENNRILAIIYKM